MTSYALDTDMIIDPGVNTNQVCNYLSIYLSIYLFICLSIYLSIRCILCHCCPEKRAYAAQAHVHDCNSQAQTRFLISILKPTRFRDMYNDVSDHEHSPICTTDEYDDDETDGWANEDDLLAEPATSRAATEEAGVGIKFELGGSAIDCVVAGRGSGLSVTGHHSKDIRSAISPLASSAPSVNASATRTNATGSTTGKPYTSFGRAGNRGGVGSSPPGSGEFGSVRFGLVWFGVIYVFVCLVRFCLIACWSYICCCILRNVFYTLFHV
jgi:hypothetical protein